MTLGKIGQIIPNIYEVSRQISAMSAREDVHVIVEIGTWNGMGSTQCVLQGLKNKTDYLFKSYECNKERSLESIENNQGNPDLGSKFIIISGKLVDEKEMTDWFDVNSLSVGQKQWLQKDIEWMSEVPNVLDTVPEKIDLLILDGGEFSTYKEWMLLKDRTRYVVMDDTTQLKTKRIRQEMIDGKEWNILVDCLTERNGFLVAERL